MKTIFKKIIIKILIFEAKLVIRRFKPKIIAVTGSVGKTSSKDAIYTALSGTFKIRKNQKSLNSEIGTPLTILGLENAWDDPILWIKNIIFGFLNIFKFNYPKWLVLEIGVDRPGDIARVAKWLNPDVVLITALPSVPVHVEYFESAEEIIKEKLSIIKYMKPNGSLILNADDPLVLGVKENSKRKVITYGESEKADVVFSNTSIIYEESDNGIRQPVGFSFKISYAGNIIPMTLSGVLGIPHAYPVVSAIAVGLSQSVPFLNMTNALTQHESPKGRMNIILGKNDSVIIDDTYNASPIAMQRAIETLVEIKTNGPKIAVLGDMLELGSFSVGEHKKIGEQIAKNKISFLIAIGLRSEYIVKAAIGAGMNEKKIFYVKTSEEAIEHVESKLKPGAIVLVKASQSIRAEKIVAGIMRNPEKKKELLVRQESAWENR